MKAGVDVTVPPVTQPDQSQAAPNGQAWTWLREESFSIGGQTHTLQIYRSNLFAAVLGLRPNETDISAEFVLIPGGNFMMGTTPETLERVSGEWATPELLKDEMPQRKVNVTPLLLARTELTQALWWGVAHLGGLPRNPSFFKHAGDKAPVETVSWNDAQLWLKSVNLGYDVDLRLPSEAEWEYATRAGTMTPLYNGKYPGQERFESPALAEIGWFLGNAEVDYEGGIEVRDGRRMGTLPVGAKPPNAFGLVDTIGNVMEWCEDFARGSYQGAPGDGSVWRGNVEWEASTLIN